MPVEKNSFSSFKQTEAADRAALEAMGLAMEQAAIAQYPASGIGVITGNLKRSHTCLVASDHVDVGVTADYGMAVHEGSTTRRGRPWLKTAMEKNKKAITDVGMKVWARKMGGES